MRLVLTSDLHGRLPEIPICDFLLIAGDICPIEDHHSRFQATWLRKQFVPWLAAVPARHKLFVAGNHDGVFFHDPELLTDIVWPGDYLQDGGVEREGIFFWGSPWATELFGWPFTAPEPELADHWRKIDNRTQVLIVHGPPYGHGDAVIGRRSGDVLNVGSRTLLDTITRLPHLRLVVFGHIHEGSGIYQHQDIQLINASYMDQCYCPTNPLRFYDWATE